MNKLPPERQAEVLRALVEGNSIRFAVRLTGDAKGIVLNLLADTGGAAARFQDAALVDLDIKRIQADELWAFCGMKQKNVPDELKGVLGYGDVYTLVALDPASKVVPCWRVGQRTGTDAVAFLANLAGRMRNRVQLTTDGYLPYVDAVAKAFGEAVHYAMLVKMFASVPSSGRYSPPACVGTRRQPISGDPDPRHGSTSHVERQNLTMRMQMRRFTRLTNAFSLRVENLAHAVALHFLWYNFGRLHQRHRDYTPAQAAGIADHRWTIEEVVALLHSQRDSN